MSYCFKFSSKIINMQALNKQNITKLAKTLGQIISSHRKAQGKTMYNISAESCMRKSTWRNVELGVDIRISTLWKIAEGLDIDVVELVKELKEKLGKDFSLIDYE